MKKFTLLLFAMLASIWLSHAQTVNEPTNWPNAAWTLSGTFDAPSLIGDPTVDANFSYDDDGAGSGSTDILIAESPIIDLTAADANGEDELTLDFDYNYNFGSIFNLEYFDADAASWVLWQAIADNSSTTSNWCGAITGTTTSIGLDISGFTATQLSGFRYRFNYDASSVFGWGFCISTATLNSAASTPPPAGATCGTAVAVTPGTITGTTITPGTNGADLTLPDGANAAWFAYTATADGTIDVSACGSGIDTDLAVATGPCGTFTNVIATDDTAGCPDFSSEVTGYAVVTGQVYYIEWSDEWDAGPFDWSLTFTPAPTCDAITGLTIDSFTGTTADISWAASTSGETAWEIAVQPDGTGTPGTADGSGTDTTSNSPYSETGLMSNTAYEVYVRAECTAGTEFGAWVGPVVFTTEAACGDTVYDTGGPGGNYSNSESYTITYLPDAPGNVVTLDFTSVALETCCDDLSIYDGLDTAAPVLNADLIAPATFTATNPAGAITIEFTSDGSVTNPGWEANYTCAAPPTCLDITGLTIDSFTATTAEISWAASPSGETAWEIAVQPDGTGEPDAADGSGTDTTSNPYSETGLLPTTAYEVYVRAECTAGSDFGGWVGPVDFTTPCAAEVPDYTEDFTAFLPSCWEQATNGDLTAGPASLGGFGWSSEEFAHLTTTGGGAVNKNLFGGGPDIDWLLSPEFDLSADGYELLIDVAMTDYNATTQTDGFNPGDEVRLVWSNDGTNWTTLVQWDEFNVPSATGQTETVDLTGITGSTVQFALYVSEGTTGRDIDFHADNFIVRTPFSCTQAVVDGTPTVVEDCGAGTFTIDVEFTSVGDATDVNDGTDDFTITGTTATAGPYPIGTTVNLNVVHTDGACDFAIAGDFVDACPPSNDDFVNAITFTCADGSVSGNTTAATLDEDDAPDAPGFNADTDSPNVWYGFLGTGQDITLSTINGASDFDTEILVFTGSSGNLNFVAAGYDESGSPDFLAEVTFTAEAGVQYWVSVEGYNVGDTGSFQMDITCAGDPTYVYIDGTWAPSDPNGTATITDDLVIVSGDATISSNTTCNAVFVQPGTSLTVSSGVTLTNVGPLVLESNSTTYSSLIRDGVITGIMLYQRHVNISAASGTTTGSNDLVSAPLTGQQFDVFATNNPNILNNGTNFLFGPFEKVTGQYVNWAATETATLDAGVGYRTGTTNNLFVTFQGNAENGVITNDIINGGPIRQEWNLVGNPYPSYLNVQDFLSHDVGGVTNLQLFDAPTAAIYGYDGEAINGWTIYNNANTSPSTLIAPGQGFFVSADATNSGPYDLEFTPAMRSTGSSDDFIPGRNAELVYVKLKASTANNEFGTDIYFNSNASLGFDLGYDAALWGDTAPDFALYSHLVQDNAGEAIALQAVSSTNLSDVVIPLGVNANQGEQLTFSIAEMTLPASVNVYLEDVVANTVTLLNNSDYIITPTTALSGTGRFFLRTSEDALSTIENSLDALNIFALHSSKEIVVSGQLQENTVLNLYDIQGRKVLTTKLDSVLLQNRIDVSSINSGVYIVTVQNNSQELTKKVIIK